MKYNFNLSFVNFDKIFTIFITFFFIESSLSSEVKNERKIGVKPFFIITYAAIGLSKPPESKDINFLIVITYF